MSGDWVSIPLDGSMAFDQIDSYIIQTALERHGHTVMAAARALGNTRETLRYRIRKYRLEAAGTAAARDAVPTLSGGLGRGR